MKGSKPAVFNFEIDRLTNSIQNVITGDSFDMVISLISVNEQKIIKKSDWVFDWKKELKSPLKSVYKITIAENYGIN